MTQLFIKKLDAKYGSRGTLLLLHGWGFDHRCWQPLVPYLQNDYDLVLVDLPSFGSSSPIAANSAEDWLDQLLVLLERALDEIDCGAGVLSVIGWSLGGQIGLRLLQRHARIESVVGIATNLQFCACDNWSAAMDKDSYADFLQSFSAAPEQTLKHFLRLVSAGDAHVLELRKLLKNMLSQFDPTLTSNWYFALQSLQLLDHAEVEFDRPVLLLLSENDALVPVSVERALIESQGISCVRLDRASHGHLLIEPKKVADAMVNFLNGY